MCAYFSLSACLLGFPPLMAGSFQTTSSLATLSMARVGASLCTTWLQRPRRTYYGSCLDPSVPYRTWRWAVTQLPRNAEALVLSQWHIMRTLSWQFRVSTDTPLARASYKSPSRSTRTHKRQDTKIFCSGYVLSGSSKILRISMWNQFSWTSHGLVHLGMYMIIFAKLDIPLPVSAAGMSGTLCIVTNVSLMINHGMAGMTECVLSRVAPDFRSEL